jgi:hypothetical protein
MPPAAEKDQILYGKWVKISLHFSSLSSRMWAGSHDDDDDDDDNVDKISLSIL